MHRPACTLEGFIECICSRKTIGPHDKFCRRMNAQKLVEAITIAAFHEPDATRSNIQRTGRPIDTAEGGGSIS
jgi:hypothetical protein